VTDTRSRTARLVARRIRRRLSDGDATLAFDPLVLPPAVMPQPSETLDRDVETLRSHFDLTAVAPSSPRPFVGAIVNRLKQRLFQMLRELTVEQTAYNLANAGAAAELRSHAANQAQRIEELHRGVEQLSEAVDATGEAIRSLGRRIRLLEDERPPGVPHAERLQLVDAARGSESEIRERHRQYVSRFDGRRDIVDLGCGRGEFLELLRDADISSWGVDADEAMVALCRRKGLRAEHEDAFVYLTGVAPDSLGGAFVAQLIEHLHPSRVLALLRELHRTLVPGGIAVIETVNPETLLTYQTFYLDPTHVRPYNAQLIVWAAQAAGFGATRVEYTLEVPTDEAIPELPADGPRVEAFNRGIARLNRHLYGPRGYAVVATK
jgi:SAM-dependent methyltransferase